MEQSIIVQGKEFTREFVLAVAEKAMQDWAKSNPARYDSAGHKIYLAVMEALYAEIGHPHPEDRTTLLPFNSFQRDTLDGFVENHPLWIAHKTKQYPAVINLSLDLDDPAILFDAYIYPDCGHATSSVVLISISDPSQRIPDVEPSCQVQVDDGYPGPYDTWLSVIAETLHNHLVDIGAISIDSDGSETFHPIKLK